MSKYEGAFALLEPDAQQRLVNHRCEIVEKMRRSTPAWQLATVTDLYCDAMQNRDITLQFTELGALIDLLTDEQTAQVTS